MPTILLVRHAQASFGAADYDVLSERGAEQVDALVAGLERRGVRAGRVVAGSLRRQIDTARPCAEAVGAEVGLDPRLDEYDDADILARHSSTGVRLARDPGDDSPQVSSREFQDILDGALTAWVAAGAGGPTSRTWPAFLSDATGALGDVARSLDRGETAIVVTSGGILGALCATLMGLPPESFVKFNHVCVNAGISKVVVGRGGMTLVSFNDHAHLEEAGGGSLITYR